MKLLAGIIVFFILVLGFFARADVTAVDYRNAVLDKNSVYLKYRICKSDDSLKGIRNEKPLHKILKKLSLRIASELRGENFSAKEVDAAIAAYLLSMRKISLPVVLPEKEEPKLTIQNRMEWLGTIFARSSQQAQEMKTSGDMAASAMQSRIAFAMMSEAYLEGGLNTLKIFPEDLLRLFWAKVEEGGGSYSLRDLAQNGGLKVSQLLDLEKIPREAKNCAYVVSGLSSPHVE